MKGPSLQERTFLAGLTALTKQCGVSIGACGCCDSPWLSEVDQDELDVGMYWLNEDGKVVFVTPDDLDWNKFRRQRQKGEQP